MGQRFATCGHDITDYSWDWPGVWSQGYYEGGVGPHEPWSFSTLCFPCIMEILKRAEKKHDVIVQFSDPRILDASYRTDNGELCACGDNCKCKK